MSKHDKFLNGLNIWQDETYESVDTASDIRVFNTIGTIITLTGAKLIEPIKTFDLVTEILSLDEEEKKKAFKVLYDAYELSNKEEDTNEEEGN